jgi:NADH:ubiquinone oxidoreductase subunit 5 (subunit L)/multisubunit Na+/H+ antiporter MnhA subunit
MNVLLLLTPFALAASALAMHLHPPARAHWRLRLPEIAALAALGLGALTAVDLAVSGPSTTPLVGAASIGLSARIDIVSVTMTLTVAFVGWVVLRFSRVALDGEARQPAFMGWMAATVACVLLLVGSGNVVQLAIGWVATGVTLHRLLLFYPGRPRARRAARKKALSGLVASAALLAAGGFLIALFGTSDIAAINAAARTGEGAEGTEAQKSLAFQQAYGALRDRILAFTALPIATLDRISLQKAVDRIAGMESGADA